MFTTNRHTTPLRYIPALLAVAALGLSACSTEELPDNGGNSNGKTAIEFAMSNTGGIGMSLDSRAAASDASRAGFGSETRIVMRIGSTNGSETKYTRTTATASKQVTTGTQDYSTVTFAQGTEMRYWDDAHGRKSQLSVYAVAIPDKTAESLLPVNKLKFTASSGSNWATEDASTSADNNCIAWEVSADQSAAGTVSNQDLCYSNNIQADEERGKNGVYRYDFDTGSYPTFPGCDEDGTIKQPGLENGVMKYTTPSASKPGKFDRGHMIFRHALSRITVKIKAGDGYTADTEAFAFTYADGGNVHINKVPTSGTFDIVAGAWKTGATTSTIKKMEITKDLTADDKSYTLVANLLPGYEIRKGNGTNIIQFELDYNHYNITEAMLYGALQRKTGITQQDDTKITMEQGVNYEINITVSKKKIDNITATLVPWAKVSGDEQNVNNAYITLSLQTFTGYECRNFDFYRLNDPYDSPVTSNPTTMHYKWYSKYEGPATLTAIKADGSEATGSDPIDHYKTNWYYDNNKAFYHFRTVNKGTNITTDANVDYFTITSSNDEANDPHWGAPMCSGADIKYAVTGNATATRPTGGFASSIHGAIGATESKITITELHMLSKINVILKTTTTDNKVQLLNGTTPATVKLVRYMKEGKVELGRGLVTVTSTTATEDDFKAPDASSTSTFFSGTNITNPYQFMAVPQELKRGDADADYVGLEITTPDGNVYKINRLSDITASSVGSEAGQGQTVSDNITRWLPNHHYTYTFNLTKTGVTATATVAKWNEVTADDKNVTIE